MSAQPSPRSPSAASFFEHCALADYDPARPEARRERARGRAFSAHGIDASSKDAVRALIRETKADAVLNSVDQLFNVPIVDGACFKPARPTSPWR